MFKKIAIGIQVAMAVAAIGIGTAVVATKHTKTTTKTVTVTVTKDTSTPIYVRNLSRFMKDSTIKNDIPAWEHAINVDFAKYWFTTKYKIVFLGRKQAPHNGITAEFVSRGPVQGALAYHWTERNNSPSITVYAGTGAYYGFDNSVSFTHELEELAADPVTSYLNIGWPDAFYWLEDTNGKLHQVPSFATGWFSEVSDPVEADTYTLPGADGTPVKISDFVTPAWFNDGTGSRFDFLGLCQQPLWIRPGGYAQYLDGTGWNVVQNWRKGHPTDRGFFHDHETSRK